MSHISLCFKFVLCCVLFRGVVPWSSSRRNLLQLISSVPLATAYSYDVSAMENTPSKPWTATHLHSLSLEEAAQNPVWEMGRWPDPILRRSASPVSESFLASPTLKQVCQTLQRVARQEEAVGLAAQQCGIDARVVYLDHPRPLWMINPRIVNRSPEESMKVWEEACLVLPPSFKATVLRDAWIDVQYWTPEGTLQRTRFQGEPARCIQHEMGTY
jgi:peptide deformylase